MSETLNVVEVDESGSEPEPPLNPIKIRGYLDENGRRSLVEVHPQISEDSPYGKPSAYELYVEYIELTEDGRVNVLSRESKPRYIIPKLEIIDENGDQVIVEVSPSAARGTTNGDYDSQTGPLVALLSIRRTRPRTDLSARQQIV